MALSSDTQDENWNEEDMRETARGKGEEGLVTVPYFLSQHPLASRGKSIPKVKGQPGGIPFVLSARPYKSSLPKRCVCMWVHLHLQSKLSISPLLQTKHEVSLISLFWSLRVPTTLRQPARSASKDCLAHFLCSQKFNDRQPLQKKKGQQFYCAAPRKVDCPHLTSM